MQQTQAGDETRVCETRQEFLQDRITHLVLATLPVEEVLRGVVDQVDLDGALYSLSKVTSPSNSLSPSGVSPSIALTHAAYLSLAA